MIETPRHCSLEGHWATFLCHDASRCRIGLSGLHSTVRVSQRACTDAFLQRDRRGWLPTGSPFHDRNDSDVGICSVDIVSQHADFMDRVPAMSFDLQLVTRSTTEAQDVAQRLHMLLDSGIINEFLNLHCVPEGGSGCHRMEALLTENVKIIQPHLETSLQQPLLDQPAKLRLLTVPSFLKMLEVRNSPEACAQPDATRNFTPVTAEMHSNAEGIGPAQ